MRVVPPTPSSRHTPARASRAATISAPGRCHQGGTSAATGAGSGGAASGRAELLAYAAPTYYGMAVAVIEAT